MESMILDKKEIKKILLVRSDGIGDFVLSLPALNLIKDSFPDAEITLFTGSWQREIAEASQLFNEVITWEASGKSYFSSPKRIKYLSYRMFGVLPRLRSYKFDLAIDFRNDNFVNRVIIWLSKARIRLGFNMGGLEFLLTDTIPQRRVHRSEHFLDLVKYLSGRDETLPFKFNIPDKDLKEVDRFLDEEGIASSDMLVVISPAARWQAKAWPGSKFAQLSDRLLDLKGVRVVFMGAKEDLPRITEIKKLMVKKPLVCAGSLSLIESAALISKSRLFIGNDTAPMHIAALFEVPVIALFGQTDPKVFGPRSRNSISIRKIDQICPDCSRKLCRYQDNFCMDKITVEEVYALSRRFLM